MLARQSDGIGGHSRETGPDTLARQPPAPQGAGSIQRATHGQAAALEDVGVDHGGAHVLVAEEFLHRTDVVAVFQEMGSEGVAEGVAGNALANPGLLGGLPDCSLQVALVQMMAADNAGAGVH